MTDNNMEQWMADLLRLSDDDNRKKTDKQARILEAAIEIFSEKGYAATSTSEIAQRAGVAEGTIFRHYKTKKELLLSIAGPIAVKLVAPFLMRSFVKLFDLPYNRIEDFFRTIVRDRIQFARNNAKLIKILALELPLHPEMQENMKTLIANLVYQRGEKIIKHFQEQGQIIEAPPWRIIRSSISLFLGMIVTHLFLLPEIPFNEEEEIECTLDILMYGIARRQEQG